MWRCIVLIWLLLFFKDERKFEIRWYGFSPSCGISADGKGENI
jgi:hypothetical protein